jgi:hypothetical protein
MKLLLLAVTNQLKKIGRMELALENIQSQEEDPDICEIVSLIKESIDVETSYLNILSLAAI